MNKLMITIIYLSVILFASCQSQNDVQKAINKYMNENAYNPKSYNWIELKLNSYITLAESFDCHIQSYKEEIRGIEKEIDRMKEFNKSFSDTFYKESEFTEKNTVTLTRDPATPYVTEMEHRRASLLCQLHSGLFRA